MMVLHWLKRVIHGKKEPAQSMQGRGDEWNDYDPIPGVEHAQGHTHVKKEEKEWEPVLETPAKKVSNTQALKKMEAGLFMASKGLSIEELGKIAEIPLLHARTLAAELVEHFNARESALEIVESSEGYRMKVRAPFDESVSHLAGSTELSPGEMKTLAFIAYKQPLVQSQLVQVRSNTAYDHLHTLVEKGFVAREPKGRSYMLRTTKKFADYFGAHALKLRPMKKESESATTA